MAEKGIDPVQKSKVVNVLLNYFNFSWSLSIDCCIIFTIQSLYTVEKWTNKVIYLGDCLSRGGWRITTITTPHQTITITLPNNPCHNLIQNLHTPDVLESDLVPSYWSQIIFNLENKVTGSPDVYATSLLCQFKLCLF